MASNQIMISTNPTIGARYFIPFETNIILNVPRLTSQTRAKNINNGNTINEYVSELIILKNG